MARTCWIDPNILPVRVLFCNEVCVANSRDLGTHMELPLGQRGKHPAYQYGFILYLEAPLFT